MISNTELLGDTELATVPGGGDVITLSTRHHCAAAHFPSEKPDFGQLRRSTSLSRAAAGKTGTV